MVNGILHYIKFDTKIKPQFLLFKFHNVCGEITVDFLKRGFLQVGTWIQVCGSVQIVLKIVVLVSAFQVFNDGCLSIFGGATVLFTWRLILSSAKG